MQAFAGLYTIFDDVKANEITGMKESVLLLHGALGSKAQLAVLHHLLAQFYTVHPLDFGGHGGLPLPPTFSISAFVEEMIRYLNDQNLEHVHIFGYSMGGYVALQMARDYPERVERIATLGTKFHWNPESAAKEVRMMNPDVIQQKIPHFAETLRARHAPADWKTNMRLTADMMTALGDGLAMREMDFRAIEHHVLITRCAEDHMVTREESERIAVWLPQGSYRELPGCKHPIEMVDMGMLSSVCREWFFTDK